MRIAILTITVTALAVTGCGAASKSTDAGKDATPVDSNPIDTAADNGNPVDMPADTPRESPGTSPDAIADAFFPFPETMRPPEGLADCMIFSPASGGGCICTVSKGGHLYQVNCVGNSGPCTCTIDNVPSKTIDHDVCGMGFIRECDFP